MPKYKTCINEGSATYNSAGLLRCNSKDRCPLRLRLENGVFCRQPLLDEQRGRAWLNLPPKDAGTAKER
jgi:hypothetical protein